MCWEGKYSPFIIFSPKPAAVSVLHIRRMQWKEHSFFDLSTLKKSGGGRGGGGGGRIHEGKQMIVVLESKKNVHKLKH